MKAKYLNPFTDFGFKKLFGEEASKPLLIDFLNALLPQNSPIVDLAFKNGEQLGQTDADRKAIYDIYCENERGEKFIVELQKANGATSRQNFFKDRTIYYSTFPIREQAERGEWNYRLKAVYCVGILDFTFNDYTDPNEASEVLHTVQLKNQHGHVFYDKLTYLYVEMPNFTLQEDQLQTRLDQWLYFIKHLEDFQYIPAIFGDAVFEQAFEKAALAQLGPAELDSYENSLKIYRDLKGVVDTAYDDGKAEGLTEGEAIGAEKRTIELARSMKAEGLPTDLITRLTGLSPGQVDGL